MFSSIIVKRRSRKYFASSKKSILIKEGLSQFGAYEKPGKPIRILFLHSDLITRKAELLSTLLKDGIDGYYGFEKHFHTNLEIEFQPYQKQDFNLAIDKVAISRALGYDVVICHLPTDQSYIGVKAKLINSGVVSQCIRDATFNNINQYSLWNFALDLYVKSGYTPWTLYPKEKLPNADLFIGLSYSSKKVEQTKVNSKLLRTLACINVFSADGEWRHAYYDADTFEEGDENSRYDFEKRGQHVGALIRNAILSAQAQQGQLKQIHLHYNKRFSAQEMNNIYKSVSEVIKDPQLYFISITTDHTVRLFNPNNKGMHQHRGGGILMSDNTLYLCTSGYSKIKTSVKGTPLVLRVKAQVMPEEKNIDINDIAIHMQALTKLNYRSTFAVSTLPATIAFSKELARTINELRSINQFQNILINNRLWWI